MFTGFRVSEIRMLRWRQIDFIAEVPLLQQLRVALLEPRTWIEQKLETVPEPDHYIFPFANRGKPVYPIQPCTNIASAWVARPAGCERYLRLHDLRHMFATLLLEAGNFEAIVRELIGHVDKHVIQRYTHIRRPAKRDAIRRAFAMSSDRHIKGSPKVDLVSPSQQVLDGASN
jgi:integrase